MNFTHYLQELQNNLTRGSERTHYPALKNLVDSGMLGIITGSGWTGETYDNKEAEAAWNQVVADSLS